jgi:hypothetical protein
MNFRQEAKQNLLVYLDKLERRERKEFLELGKRWESISGTLEGLIRRLSELESLSENQLYQLELYKQFLQDSRVVINTYNQIAEGIIIDEQEAFARLGLQSAQDLLGARFFNKLNIDAVKFMVGNTTQGTPLFNLLNQSYPETVERITDTLVESMALGRSPIVTARLLREDMDGNLNRALRIARTEQINVFRESQTLQYIESGIVRMKDWLAEPDACEICQDGVANNPYELDEIMDSHPNCRCAWSPVL